MSSEFCDECHRARPDCGCSQECDPDRERGFVITRRMDRGDTIVIAWTVIDAQRSPIDFSNPSTKAWFTLKDYVIRADVQALWQGTLGAGIVQEVVGTIVVTIPASSTANLPDGVVKLYYDLQVRDSLGRVSTIEKGLFQVDPDVTKSIS